MVEFMQQGTTMSEVYCKTLKKKLHTAIQNNRHGMLLHDNVGPHTAARTSTLLDISTGSCLTTLLTALISLCATTTCFTYPKNWL
jgi:hypothetical protein